MPSLRPLDAEQAPGSRATHSLADLTPEDLTPQELTSQHDAAPAGGESEPPATTNDDRQSALRLYAEGRLRLADGETDLAISMLDRAVALDPASPELWRALGDARRAERYENSAGEAYRRAAESGIDEPQALLFAGLHALSQDEPTDAAIWLLRSVRATPPHADPLVAYAAHAVLGEALIELGYLDAGAEALTEGLSIPSAARVPTQVGREAADVQRRLGPLRLLLGDTLLRLGRNADAAAAYESARGLPGAEGVRDRLIYALRTSGNDAGAAVVLIDEVRSSARLAPDTARLLAALAESINPRKLVADAIAQTDDRGSASRRADLIAARAASLPRADALRVLSGALADRDEFSSPSTRTLLSTGLTASRRPTRGDTLGDPSRAIRWITETLDEDPTLAADAAWALTAAERMPQGLSAAIRDAGVRDERATPLLTALALRQRDTDRIRALLDARGTPIGAADLVRTVELAAAIGRWDAVDNAIESLRALEAPRAIARALAEAQRTPEALRILRGLEPRSVDDLLDRAALESALINGIGEAERARNDLEAARDLDPLDERIYAALLAFHAPDGPARDDDAFTAIGRQLRTVLPESPLLRTMLAGELLRRGLINDAASIAIPLLRAAPTDPARQDAVLNLWRRRTAAKQGDRNELDLVRSLADAHPNDAGLVRLLAGGLVLAGDAELAEAELARFATGADDRSLASLREQIIREGLADTDKAESLAIDRLGGPTRSIDASAELLALHANAMARGDASPERLASILDATRTIPSNATLTASQRNAVTTGVSRAAIVVDSARRDARDIEPFQDPLLDLFSWSAGRDLQLAPGIHGLRLDLLNQRGDPAGAILDAAEHAIDQQDPGGELRRAFYRRAADLLVERGETSRAFDWIRDRSHRGSTPDSEPRSDLNPDGGPSLNIDAFQEWFRLVIVTGQSDAKGSPARAKAMIDDLIATGAAGEAWDAVRPNGPDGPVWSVPSSSLSEADRESKLAGDLAYLLALYAPDPTGEGLARAAYLRLALDYDENHAWAANDLGYTMLEAGGDLAEAERLIEIAYRGNRDAANIVDSLGWVRYHRGKLEDSTDPQTGEEIPGAVTLLQRAADLSESDDDGVVHDHLGDALYAAGRTEDAIAAWRQAARMANASMSRLRASGRTGGVRSEEIADLAVRAIMKPNALQMGQAPAVEPQRGLEDVGNKAPGEDEPDNSQPGATPPGE